MNINKKVKMAVAAVIIAACAFGGYQYYQTKQAEAQAASVETAKVVRMNLKSTVSATGTIKPVNSVEVSPKITARISQILVKENDHVTAGQTVAILDGKDYQAQRDQAQFRVTNTLREYNRAKELYAVGADTKQALDNAEFNYDTAVSQLNEAESDVAETVITAPMDGIVVGEPKSVGTMAVQGNNNPTVIMYIADTSQKQILAKIDETDIGQIQVGQTATFTVEHHVVLLFVGQRHLLLRHPRRRRPERRAAHRHDGPRRHQYVGKGKCYGRPHRGPQDQRQGLLRPACQQRRPDRTGAGYDGHLQR